VGDSKDGTYRLSFALSDAGPWKLGLQVNGQTSRTVATLTAVRGLIEPTECELRPPPSAEAGAPEPVGGTCELHVVLAAVAERKGRRCSGTEAVKASVTAPSGLVADVPVSPLEEGAGFRLRCMWPETGMHTVSVTLGGAPVLGSPLAIDVATTDVCLASSILRGPGSVSCAAGQPAKLVVQAHDRRGNALTAANRKHRVAVNASARTPEGAEHPAEVEDIGDGTYEVTYTAERAGPVTLALQSPTGGMLHGVTCEAGPMDPQRCVVDATEVDLIEAGTTGRLRVARNDRCGNALPPRERPPRFTVRSSGPEPVAAEMVEVGNGSAEVHVKARAAGRYHLYLYSAESRAEMPGSPFPMQVVPGAANASSCRASMVQGPGGLPVEADGVQAGEEVRVAVEALDTFGNRTEFKRWQGVSVRAAGPDEVAFGEARDVPDEGAGRATFAAQLSRAGTYLVWVTVGGQAVGGWPRTLRVRAGAAQADLVNTELPATQLLVGQGAMVAAGRAQAGGMAVEEAPDEDVAALQAETRNLRQKLEKYEIAAKVVVEAARQKGVTLQEQARDAAYAEAAGENEPAQSVVNDSDSDWDRL